MTIDLCHRIINDKHVIWAVDSKDHSKNFVVSGYDLSGHGNNVEEAINDFMNKLSHVRKEIEVIEQLCTLDLVNIEEVE